MLVMQKFKGKHILLDTNILIALLRHQSSLLFDDFLRSLESLNLKSVVEEATLFEFRRGSRRQSDLDTKNAFLDFLQGGENNRMILPSSTSKEILENAQKLALLYSHKHAPLSKQISFVDCLVAAQLMKYGKNICLATTDNNDYPLFIFDRDVVLTFDSGDEIINIGIYTFNQKKFDQCERDFKRA